MSGRGSKEVKKHKCVTWFYKKEGIEFDEEMASEPTRFLRRKWLRNNEILIRNNGGAWGSILSATRKKWLTKTLFWAYIR